MSLLKTRTPEDADVKVWRDDGVLLDVVGKAKLACRVEHNVNCRACELDSTTVHTGKELYTMVGVLHCCA